MAGSVCCIRMAFAFICASLASADEIAWADVAADGSLNNRGLDVAVSSSRGAENFFLDNPMDNHDWVHTAAVRKSLSFVRPRKPVATGKVAKLMEELRPMVSAMPTDSAGRLSNGTARYALHRLFVEKHGWSIKGLQPAGASWIATLSVTDDVKDITKYMVPTYLQDVLTKELGAPGFDLQSIAVLAAALEHLVHTEIVNIIYSVFTTLGLKIPGRKSEAEIDLALDTFMMVYAFGLNLDVSMIADVQRAKSHLERSHPVWPALRAFAKAESKRFSQERELSFTDVVQVAEAIGEGYAKFHAADCRRVTEELAAKPSYRGGRVQMSEMKPSESPGRRSLLTESTEELEGLGVFSGAAAEGGRQLIISNYINSQATCLSTASFYAACCINECEGFLATLEREAGSPSLAPERLATALAALPKRPAQEHDALVQEVRGLVEKDSNLVSLHGYAFSEWMHRAFPLECPAPSQNGTSVANPKTPDEWMGAGSAQVQPLEEMIAETAKALKRYTTNGKEADQDVYSVEAVQDATNDIIRLGFPRQAPRAQRHVVGTAIHLAAILFSMAAFAAAALRSVRSATVPDKQKAHTWSAKDVAV